MSPPLDRLLKGGAFEFQMGLRRGSEEFFHNHEDAALLDERRRWLNEDADRCTAIDPDGEPLFAELLAFVRGRNPSITANSIVELGAAWEPDFLLLRADADGVFRLVAGCVCFPSHWVLHEKMGLPLAHIHVPVPTVNATLAAKIDTFLASLRDGAVWERWNWGLAATPHFNDHPARGLARLDAASTLDRCWFRSEHQAFRLLPETRGILFAIRIGVVPLTEIAADRTLASRLAEELRTMPPEIAAYKGLATAREPLASELLA